MFLFPSKFLKSADSNYKRGQLKRVSDQLPHNIMTLIFHLYSSQELYLATDDTYHTLTELETIFPSSAFLKTQRALLYYHSKGKDTNYRVRCFGLSS
jgi:hypothetical protein